jgi:hypothetical protein
VSLKTAERARRELEAFHAEYFIPIRPDATASDYETEYPEEELLDLDEVTKHLPGADLPRQISSYLRRCVTERPRNRWIQALRYDFEGVVARTRQLLERCSRTTGLTPEELMDHADFDSNDLRQDGLDSAIAELRAVAFLDSEGCNEIKLLKRRDNRPSVDIVAIRGDDRFAFDVASTSALSVRRLETLAEFIVAVCQEKAEQLRVGKEDEACTRAGVIFIVNSDPALIWGYQPRYREILEAAFERLGRPLAYHLAIVTGQESEVSGIGYFFKGSGDVIYPDWPMGQLDAVRLTWAWMAVGLAVGLEHAAIGTPTKSRRGD